MNYNELFIAIKNYLQNDFPSNIWTDVAGTGTTTSTGTEQIDLFIKQAETRIYNSVQLPVQRKNVTGTTTLGNKYLSLPADWLSNYSIAVVTPVTGEYEYLLNKDVNFIRQAFPYPAVSGKPLYYAIFDQNTYILGPTPDAAYTMEMHYNAYPASIVDIGTSWLGSNFSTVLLYGALVEAYIFLKGEADLLQMYQANYNDALNQLKRLADGLDRQDAYRSGQARVQVT